MNLCLIKPIYLIDIFLCEDGSWGDVDKLWQNYTRMTNVRMYKKVTKRWCSIWNWNKWLDTTACNRLRSWDWRLLNPWAATHKGWVWIPRGIYDHIYLRIDHTKFNYSCFRKMDLFGNGSIWQHSFWRCRKKTDERISENNGLFATLTRLMFKLELKWPQNFYLNMRYPQIDPFPTTIVIWYMHIFKDIYVCVYIYISMVFLYK